MISTSTDYQTQVLQRTQKWNVKAVIDYTDYNLDNSIEPGVYEEADTSDSAQLHDGIETPTYEWMYFDTWTWGRHFRSESSTSYQKGALAKQVSDPNDSEFNIINGGWSGYGWSGYEWPGKQDYPRFSVSFASRTVSSVKAVFDQRLEEWGEDFDIVITKTDGTQTTEAVTGNTSYKWTKTLSSPVLQAVNIELVVKKWSKESAQAKVMEMFTSVSVTYEGDEVIDLTVLEESQPDESTVPIGNASANSCNLTLVNLDRAFDNENTASKLAGNVIKNRRIKAYTSLNDLAEWIPMGVYYSKKWQVNNEKLQAKVISQDILSIMEDTEFLTSQFITPPGDTVKTYTTTADFNGFARTNVDVGTNEMQLGGEANYCSDNPDIDYYWSGYDWTSYEWATNDQVCGEAVKQDTFTYTAGTTVKMVFENIERLPTGTRIKYFISYKTEEEYNEVENNEFIYTPEDISDTSQIYKLKVFFISPGETTKPVVEEVKITISQYVSLYSLAAKIVDDFDDLTELIGENYQIDESYGTYEIPNAYLAPQTYRAVAALIAAAAGGRVYSGRTGTLVFDILEQTSSTSKTYTDSNTFDRSNPVNPENLYNRITVLTNPLIQDAAEDVAEVAIEIANGEVQDVTVEFNHDPVDTITHSGLPGGVTITDSTEYTWGEDIELTNASGSDQSFTLTVNAKPYRVRGQKRISANDTESQRKNGVIELIIDNPLIQTDEQAEAIANSLVGSFGTQRRQTKIECVPEPALEIGDTIISNTYPYIINSNSFTYKKGELTHILGGIR